MGEKGRGDAAESRLTKLFDEFKLRQDCVKWVLDTGLSAPSHPLIQLLDSEEGAKTRNAIESRVSSVCLS